MNALKVVLSSPALTHATGGSAISEASLCEQLQNHCEMVVLCPFDRFEAQFAEPFGLKRVALFQKPDVVFAYLNKRHWLNRLIKEADVFHLNGHWRWENYFLSLLCKRFGTPYVLHPRGMLVINKRRPKLKRLFNKVIGNTIVRQASKVISLSHYETNQFLEYRVSKQRVVVIPNGIPKIASLPLTQEYLLYIGRLAPRKNLLFLIDAYAEYRKKGGRLPLKLVGPTYRNYTQAIRNHIERTGMEKRVEICSPSYGTKKWEIISKAACVVYPSSDEAFGRVPFEAVAAGVLPIVPTASGSAEYLREFFPNCLYRQGSKTSLAKSFLWAENATDKADRLSKAKQWIDSTLSWDKVSKSVHGLYRELANA